MDFDRAELIRKAAEVGIDTADALLMADLARNAMLKAWESIRTVAATAPNPMLRHQIELNAINGLQQCMIDSLAKSGPPGLAILDQFEAHNRAALEALRATRAAAAGAD